MNLQMETKLGFFPHRVGRLVPGLERLHLHVYRQELFCIGDSHLQLADLYNSSYRVSIRLPRKLSYADNAHFSTKAHTFPTQPTSQKCSWVNLIRMPRGICCPLYCLYSCIPWLRYQQVASAAVNRCDIEWVLSACPPGFKDDRLVPAGYEVFHRDPPKSVRSSWGPFRWQMFEQFQMTHQKCFCLPFWSLLWKEILIPLDISLPREGTMQFLPA